MSLQARIFLFFGCIFCGLPLTSYGQNITFEKAGWLYIDNSHEFNDHWKLNTDIYARSLNGFDEFGDLLVRNWIDYSFTDNFGIGAGYVYMGQWNSDYAEPDTYYGENRLFEQLRYDIDLSDKSLLGQRIRFEQRFFSLEILPDFSQRFRYSLNWKKQFHRKFLGIAYIFLENEFFLNVEGRRISADRVLDQNRAYAGFGFNPFSEIEVEFGSYYEIENDVFGDTNHSIIFQLRIKTDF